MEGQNKLPDVHQMCCGGKNCPLIRKDGDDVVISDEQADVPVLTSLASASIRFRAEQASELRRWLEEKGF